MDEARKAKVQMELNQAKDVKDNKKDFFKHVDNKKNTREKLAGLYEQGQPSRTLGPRDQGKIWSKEDILLVEESQVREYWSKPDTRKALMGYTRVCDDGAV